MFNKRFVYFAGPEVKVEAEKSPEQKAKDTMGEFFKKPDELKGGVDVEYKNTSVADEAKRTDEAARADIISLIKEGKKAPPPKIDKDTMKQVTDALKKNTPDEHFGIQRMQVEVDDKVFNFVGIRDKSKGNDLSIYYSNDDFTVSSRTFLRDVDDATYKKLTGKDRPKNKDA
jgi:hypothetical protein